MRDLHARMLGALLAGEGLRGIAELAAAEARGPVAIVLPARGLAAASADEVPLDELVERAADHLRGGNGGSPAVAGVELEQPIEADGTTIGYAIALSGSDNGLPQVSVDRGEVLRTAALAALTEVAVADARDEVAADLRGTLLEDLRAGRVDPAETVRRAVRMGADLSSGAIAMVAEVRSERPRHAAALITGEHPGAIAEPLPASPGGEAGRQLVYALLPARRSADDAVQRTRASARAIAERLRSHGPAAYSSFCASAAELGRAISEAELMLEVIGRDERMADQLAGGIGDGVYRLLFRAMATDPAEVRRFYDETVAPLVAHDREYRTDLLGTLEAYLANDCNMNATARAVYAHRHTVAHRLGRIRELTGLDPSLGDDRERLGLGIKAYRIVAPTLPR
ncbi:MAG TPA: helix-turn-helix domain-containing protein [Solirubrobacterales bacterium]|nr:helix-turn-helix domain-containing protein [Solirubrobacterales bacterium]